MENFLNDAWSECTAVHSFLSQAKRAQEEDDKAGEELDRTAEQFVEKIEALIQLNARIQQGICDIIYQHNNR